MKVIKFIYNCMIIAIIYLVILLTVISFLGGRAENVFFLDRMELDNRSIGTLYTKLISIPNNTHIVIYTDSPGGMTFFIPLFEQIIKNKHLHVDWKIDLAASAGAFLAFGVGDVWYNDKSFVLFHSPRTYKSSDPEQKHPIFDKESVKMCWGFMIEHYSKYPLTNSDIYDICELHKDVVVYLEQLERFNHKPCYSGKKTGKLQDGWCQLVIDREKGESI